MNGINKNLTGYETVNCVTEDINLPNSSIEITFPNSTTTTTNTVTGNVYIPHPTYYEYYHYYYPLWYEPTVIKEKSKVEQAFQILNKLLENKIITKVLTVKTFIKLVNDIAGVI